MGRSVNYLSNALGISYIAYESENDDDWEYFMDSIHDLLQKRIPSIDILYGQSKWEGNEVRIFAENSLAEFGVSEYCGLVSISVRPIQDDYSWLREGLAENWIKKTWPGIQQAINKAFPNSSLKKIGNFSNGEGVYELAK